MVDELYNRPVMSKPMVTIVMLDVHVDDIWVFLDLIKENREDTQEEKRERKRRKCEEKEATKKAKVNSLQDLQDQEVRVCEIVAGVGGLRLPDVDIEGGSIADPPSATFVDLVLIADGTHIEDGGTALRAHVLILYEMAP